MLAGANHATQHQVDAARLIAIRVQLLGSSAPRRPVMLLALGVGHVDHRRRPVAMRLQVEPGLACHATSVAGERVHALWRTDAELPRRRLETGERRREEGARHLLAPKSRGGGELVVLLRTEPEELAIRLPLGVRHMGHRQQRDGQRRGSGGHQERVRRTMSQPDMKQCKHARCRDAGAAIKCNARARESTLCSRRRGFLGGVGALSQLG